MRYELLFLPSFRHDIKGLDKNTAEELKKRVEAIERDPLRGKPLHGRSMCFSVRFRTFRVVYYIEGNKIYLARFGKRDIVYRCF